MSFKFKPVKSAFLLYIYSPYTSYTLYNRPLKVQTRAKPRLNMSDEPRKLPRAHVYYDTVLVGSNSLV